MPLPDIPNLFTLNLRSKEKDMTIMSMKRDVTQRTQFSYTIGADPELFVVDGNGKFVSAHDLIPGSKIQPFRVSKGAVQPDGTSAEFNIDSAITQDEFVGNIKKVLTDLNKMIKEKNPEYKLRVTPVALFDREYFDTLPGEALAFGCTPDFNAWEDGKQNDFLGTTEPFRTGAGHVHVGWTQFEDVGDSAHIFDCIEATRQLDSVLYPMSLLWDNDNKRRTLYGKIGAFRPKPYGFEYRPLSNAWIADPDLQRWVFKATVQAMRLLDSSTKQVKLWLDKDVSAALKVIKDGKSLFPTELKRLHGILTDDFDMPPLPKAYRTF